MSSSVRVQQQPEPEPEPEGQLEPKLELELRLQKLALDDTARAEQYFKELYEQHTEDVAKLKKEYGTGEDNGGGRHGKAFAAVVAAVALAAGVAAILDFFGSSFKEPADGSADGSAEGGFLVTWLILSAAAVVLGFCVKSLSSACLSCLIGCNAIGAPGEETDSIRGPTALDYLGYASQCAADAVAILTVPACAVCVQPQIEQGHIDEAQPGPYSCARHRGLSAVGKGGYRMRGNGGELQSHHLLVRRLGEPDRLLTTSQLSS